MCCAFRFVGMLFALTVPIFAQFTNIKINQYSSEPEEMTIAINPLQPENLVAGSNIDRYYYSFDGGLSWTEDTLRSQYGVYGDPCVVFDGLGNTFYAHLSAPPQGSWLDRIVVQKSVDGGKSWDAGVGIGLNGAKDQDKEWLAVDMTSSLYKNNIYMCWTEFDKYGSSNPNDSTRILFSRSTDHGLSWNPSVRISDSGGNCLDGDSTVEGAVPAVGPNGEIYVSWAGPKGILFDKSLDGGQHFGKDIFVTEQPGGWNFDVPGINRCNGLPVTLCDVSDSDFRGRVYVLWSDQRNGAENTDVFICYSDDEGESWSVPLQVNNDSGKAQQFFPWATIDPVTGHIYAVFYDRRNYTDNQTDVYLAKSSDGGRTFRNYQISNTPFIPDAGIFFGDYINITALNGKIYPIWMRLDTWDLSAWIAIIEEPLLLEGSPSVPPQTIYLSQNYPNPFGESRFRQTNSQTAIRYTLRAAGHVQLTVYTALGQTIRTLVNKRQLPGQYSVAFDATGLASGIYLYRLSTDAGYSQIRKMMVVH